MDPMYRSQELWPTLKGPQKEFLFGEATNSSEATKRRAIKRPKFFLRILGLNPKVN